jgi:hypothetical protein
MFTDQDTLHVGQDLQMALLALRIQALTSHTQNYFLIVRT